ncbi:MAG TPA: TlpA disulfide reductase family protein [Vicinamibacterales bacterium]|jgi:peroxiredoxin|nr:TlpA disulfide reductase family protein [Vicinamibacterales bacterium]
MKRVYAIAALLVLAGAPLSAELLKPAARKPATNFSLPGRDGKPVQLSTLKGKVVLLDFWATWCAGCKVEIPWFIEFDKAYRSKGLAAIGVSMDDEGWKRIEPYLQKNPISYTIVAGNFDTAAPYNITALPVTVLIDRAGRVAAQHVGVVDKKSFETELKQLLAER